MLSIRTTELRSAFAACLAVVCAACTSSGGPAPAGKVLRIGVDLPLSGVESRAATPALYGVRFFVQTHPTLDGFKVELETADDAVGGAPDPARGTANVRRFLADS